MRVVATHHAASDIAISLGNLAVEALFDAGVRWLPRVVPAGAGFGCAALVARPRRDGRLKVREPVPVDV